MSHLVNVSGNCIQNYNFACGSVMGVCISDIERGTWPEGVWEHSAEENAWMKRDEVTGDWRKLHDQEFHNLYSLQCIIRMIKWRRMRLAGHVAWMGLKRDAYMILVGNPVGKRPLGRQWRGWILLKGWCGMDWIYQAHDRDQWRAHVNMVINPRVP
jgi:hypothetical protein